MLAKKAEYINYTSIRGRTAAQAEHMERQFGAFAGKAVSLVFLVAFFLLAGIALISMQNDYSYALNQKKQQVRQLQKDNDALRVRIAVLSTPERIYTLATKELGMVAPVRTLYSADRSGTNRRPNP